MSAVLSACGAYRMRLDRDVDTLIRVPAMVPLFVGVNPSTADATINDPTIRKEIGFCKMWGAKRFMKGNVFSFRATDPRQLALQDDPVGPENDAYLEQMIAEATDLIPCWGRTTKVPQRLRHRFATVRDMLFDSGKPVRVFGFTKGRAPTHPLMLPYSTQLQEWK